MFKTKLLRDLKKAIEELGYSADDIVLSIPKNSAFGDYTTNVALQQSKLKSTKGKQSPQMFAKEISSEMKHWDYLEKIEIAGDGFINFFINPKSLMDSLHKVCNYSSLVNPEPELKNDNKQKILIEYAHPNTHKAFHIGHTRNITLGESISRLLEATGQEIFRANYQGDIGLHVAKALWGIKKAEKEPKTAEELGKAYVIGAKAYDSDEDAAKKIQEINRSLYAKDPKIMPLWNKTRQISLDYFDSIYQKLGTKFDRLFFESEVEESGKKIVEDNLGKVFMEDEGAVIFKGEDYGLHSRVFITSAGHPTYEAKDLGLAYLEKEAYPFDLAIHVVGDDQSGYFQVMLRALTAIDDWFVGRQKHLSYGMVNLSSGKMSSRTGDVITFDFLFNEVKNRVAKVMSASSTSKDIKASERDQIIDMVSIGAIKFAMLKFSPQTNISFDLEKSVSLQGDSGPYVQYTYARAKSVLRNASYNYLPTEMSKLSPPEIKHKLEDEERELLRSIEHFESIISEAGKSYSPNLLASFLLDIASSFNLFYQKHPIMKSQQSEFRLALTCAVAVVLKQGLYLLGVEAPERM